ncbi:MAG: polysaccharide deacetylase [Pseudomonadota bacterium]|nr:polysaccharide deacetylase family protein [Rubrivivax sp.]NLZ40704.1 polysaccharide deacetylase family protein [Comamonadaceae bacterium]
MGAERVPVLMYHRVDPAADDPALCVAPRRFAAQMRWLADHGYRPCSHAAFRDWYLGLAALPPHAVLLTFDDGYAGLHEHVLPVLAARGWPAAVFLVSALIGAHDRWAAGADTRGGPRALLARAQIDEMARHGFDFQSHSRTHSDLTTLDAARLHEQVAGSRRELEDLLGRAVDGFAYPYGRCDEAARAAVAQAGYRIAYSVRSGFNRPGGDALAVRRLDITGGDKPARFGRKVAMGTNDGSWQGRMRYLAARLRGAGREAAQA